MTVEIVIKINVAELVLLRHINSEGLKKKPQRRKERKGRRKEEKWKILFTHHN